MTPVRKRSMFRIRAFVYRDIRELVTDLTSELEELHEMSASIRHSNKWHDSEEAIAVEVWLESLENLVAKLETITEEPEQR